MRAETKDKIDKFVYLKLPKHLYETSNDRETGIQIDSNIPEIRMLLKQNTLIVADDSWGGILTIDLDKIDMFVSELLDIQEVYAIA